MKSAIMLTREIDDLEAAAGELSAGIREKIDFEKTTVGIAYCDADVDVGELGKLLHADLGFEIVGLTTTASIERDNGYCGMGIVLAVITGDDVDISVGSTGNLLTETFSEQIEATYNSARGNLPQDPKLMLLYAPYTTEIPTDNFLEVLDKISGQVPIFGGVATDHYDLKYPKTFRNGESFSDGLVVVLISGNIHPVFAMKHNFGGKIERKGIITKSSGNMVERIGDKTFKEFLSEITPVPEDDSVIYRFQFTPFVMELPDYEESEEPVVRVLYSIDHQTGSGGFLSKMPEGSTLSINVVQRENLAASCADTLDDIIETICRAGEKDYCMMMICTCNGRHLMMGNAKDLEANIVSGKLAGINSGINAMGFYGFGEICPTGPAGKGLLKNRYHNTSFALCAF